MLLQQEMMEMVLVITAGLLSQSQAYFFRKTKLEVPEKWGDVARPTDEGPRMEVRFLGRGSKPSPPSRRSSRTLSSPSGVQSAAPADKWLCYILCPPVGLLATEELL